MEKIKILDATPDDAREIINVLHKTWRNTYANKELGITIEDIDESYRDSYSDENIQKLKNKISHVLPNEKRFVAKMGDRIVGVATAEKDNKKNELRTMYILPEYHGKGIGTMLWNECKKFFDQSKDVFVQVATYNQKAIEFYKTLGFEDTGKRHRMSSWRLEKMKKGVEIPEMEMSIRGKREIEYE